MSIVVGSGLSSVEAAQRLVAEGPNRLPEARQASPLLLLLRQFTHFFAAMLWVAAGLAFLAGLPPLAIAIGVVVVLNGLFAFAQEYRAGQAARRLRTLLPDRVRVVRDGQPVTVSSADLVRGDLVLLEAGDRISGDLRLLEALELAVDQSLLTGESVAVRPDVGATLYAGTFVVEGEAEAVVTATGAATRLAGVAALTRETHRPMSPLTIQLHRVVTAVAIMAVTIGAALFAASMLLGLSVTEGFLFGVGVAVALVPEGLLPTVTLSLALGAQRMAARHALVRHLDAVETLGATTFICTDKTGTLTRNQMAVVEVWTPVGVIHIDGTGYAPVADVVGSPPAVAAARKLAATAVRPVRARAVQRGGEWIAEGDPMEVALDVLARRLNVTQAAERAARRIPFSPRRRFSGAVDAGVLHVIGAPEAVIPLCLQTASSAPAMEAAHDLATRGRRVLAVARRPLQPDEPADDAQVTDLVLLGLVGLEDPPRDDIAETMAACRRAGIRVAMVTGDHPGTALAVASEVGLLSPGGPVIEGAQLPRRDADLAALLDNPRGSVVARVTPEDKVRIARALQGRGHVVAMTGDGVNDAPALGMADVGVAMGASGSDVAREAADLVLLDDHFGTIVNAIELGRSTFSNIRRFLTYHLTDNVAELAPFAAWALSGGSIPLAIGVLQVLALDIGTDMLPALALGAEPPTKRSLLGPPRLRTLVDGRLLRRAFLVLGPTEAAVSMAAFLLVLSWGGWAFGDSPTPALHGVASGSAFAAIALGQLANAFACRSESRPFWGVPAKTNPLLLLAVGAEVVLLVGFLGLSPLAELLGGSWPSPTGWALAATAAVAVLLADTIHKWVRQVRRIRSRRAPGNDRTGPPGG